MLEALLEIVVGVMVVVGAGFSLIAAIGLVRLPDVYTRMHAASKAGTVGSGVILLALAIHADDAATITRALAGVAFLLLTAPIAAHLLAKAAHGAGYRLWEDSVLDDMPIVDERDDGAIAQNGTPRSPAD
jgi:multicomponent Na+:H+ antiporter subunit G